MQGPVAERSPKSVMADVIENFWLFSIFSSKAFLLGYHWSTTGIELSRKLFSLRPDLALAAGKCIVDFVLRNMTLYEERRLLVFLETCHFERSWLSAFGGIEVMLEVVKYFPFLFCLWGKNTKVKLCWR